MFDATLNSGAGAGGSGAAPPAAPGSGSTAAPPAAPGSAAASPAAPAVISWETAPQQLRTEYENQKAEAARLKAEAERWSKLGDYDQVSQLSTAHQARLTQAVTMGKSLGYTEQQIRAAMIEDPKGTLAYLQQSYQQPATPTREQMDRQLQEAIDARVKPIQERFDETINREANSLYETERERLYKSEFADGLPEDNREELFEILDGLVASDPVALQHMKFQHQTSDIKKHMEQAKLIFQKRHNSYIAHERGKGQQPPNGRNRQQQNGEAKTSFGMTAKELFRSL